MPTSIALTSGYAIPPNFKIMQSVKITIIGSTSKIPSIRTKVKSRDFAMVSM